MDDGKDKIEYWRDGVRQALIAAETMVLHPERAIDTFHPHNPNDIITLGYRRFENATISVQLWGCVLLAGVVWRHREGASEHPLQKYEYTSDLYQSGYEDREVRENFILDTAEELHLYHTGLWGKESNNG